MNGETRYTSSLGATEFSGLLPGTYPYTVTYTGLNVENGVLVISDQSLELTVRLVSNFSKISFQIRDTNFVAISNASVEFNSQVKMSDALGIAAFDTVPKKNGLSYNIFKTGFKRGNGSINVVKDSIYNITLIPGQYLLKILVVDSLNSIVPGAMVVFRSDTLITNKQGFVIFDDQKPGVNQKVYISKPFYTSDSLTIDILSDLELTSQIKVRSEVFEINFIVIDADTLPIQDAKIQLNYGEKNTDVTGKVIFKDLVPGDYPFTISKAGLTTYNGMISITNSNANEEVMMFIANAAFDVTFSVKNQDGKVVSNAEVIFEGTSEITDSSGIVVFKSVHPALNQNFTIFKAGYKEMQGTVHVTKANVTKDITFELIRYHSHFTVVDEFNKAISFANVIFNGDTLKTDSTGKVSFDKVLPGLNQSYVIFANGLISDTGKVNVINSDVQISVLMIYRRYKVTVAVSDSLGAIPNAGVALGTNILYTNSLGELVFEGVLPGKQRLAVTMLNYFPFSDSIVIAPKDTSISIKMLSSLKTVTFTIKSNTNNLLSGVSVGFDGVQKTSDLNGKVEFAVTAKDAIRLTAIKSRFISVSKTINIKSDTSIVVIMDTIITTYKVVFNVIGDNDKPLAGAMITFNNDTAYTDSIGNAVLIAPAVFNQDVIISKYLYKDNVSKLTISNNIKKTYFMTKPSYRLSFKAIDQKGMAVSNVNIKFATAEVFTDTAGVFVFNSVKTDTSYQYTATLNEFLSDTGKFDLLKDTTIVIYFNAVEILESEGTDVMIYPNPTSEYLIIKNVFEYKYVQIFDVTGSLLYETLVAENDVIINMSQYLKGLYVVKLMGSKNQKVVTVAKQ